MSPYSRRAFLQGVAGATLVALETAFHYSPLFAAAKVLQWPSRVVQLQADPDEVTPPVVTAIRLHRDGARFATCGDDHIVRIWSLADGKQLQRLEGHDDWARTIDYSPDGSLLVSAGNDRRILLWDSATGALKRPFAQHEHAIAAVKIDPNGKLLAAVGFERPARMYDLTSGQKLWQSDGPCPDLRSLAFSPNGQWLAVAGRCGAIRLLDAQNGATVREVKAHVQRVRGLAFSPDGSYLASCSEDRSLHLLPLTDSNAPGYVLPRRPAKDLAIAFFGADKLAVAGSDNNIRLWDVATREEFGLLAGHTGSIAALDSRPGTIVSGGYDTTIRIWTVADNLAQNAPPPRIGATEPARETKR